MKKRGFTLIELLTVIAIIGVLASIIMVSLTSARAKGRDAKRVTDIKNIQVALETYYNDNGAYPPDIYDPAKGFASKYMSVVPCDPNLPSGSSCASATQYQYFYSANSVGSTQTCSFYHLGATLEDSTNSALSQDADFYNAYSICIASTNSNFGGNASVCTPNGSGTGTDQCYDVTP